MAKFNTSDESMPRELSLFTLPPTQTAVQDAYYQEVRPISQISGDVPIEFHIQSSNGLDYLDLKGTELYVKLKFTKSDGSNLAAEDKVGPVNNLLSSLFQTVEVTLQNKVVMICNHYPYIAILKELLKNGEDANLSQMTTQLFIKDDTDAPADPATDGANSGLGERTAYVALSKTLDMCGPLHHPLFNLSRYLCNQVDVKVKLVRSSPKFCLMSGVSGADYKVELLDICLMARKIRVNPALLLAHAERFKETSAKFPISYTECRVQSVSKGATSFSWDSIYQARKPAKMVVCFVDTVAVAGSYTKNPYYFENCDITEICLYSDGIPVGGSPTKVKFDKTNGHTIARAFSELFRYAGKWGKDSGNDLSREAFTSGSTLFVFDLDPFYDGQESYLNLIKTANIRLHVQFGSALSKTMSCILLSETPSLFEVTESRDVIAE